MSTSFTVKVDSRPALKLFGLSVRTDMKNALNDCTSLWEKKFGPRMAEVSGRPMTEFQGESYGLSIVVDMAKGIFDYWAAMAPGAGIALPEGMSEVELPEGLYAFCTAPSLQELGAVFNFMYEKWLPEQKDYAMNPAAPCFELYGRPYLESGALEVFIPVVKTAR